MKLMNIQMILHFSSSSEDLFINQAVSETKKKKSILRETK